MDDQNKSNLYLTRVPLILAGLAVFIFVIAALNLQIWNQPPHRIGLLALLSVETFFLPYLLLPCALRLAAMFPWAEFDPTEEMGIDGENRFRQRSLVAGFILLPGLATLGAYGSAPADLNWSLQMGISLFNGAILPLSAAGFLVLFLALPDITPFLSWFANLRAPKA